jgi:hypothetical protein
MASSVLSTALGALESNLGGAETAAVSGVLSFFASMLATLLPDEVKILNDALQALIADLKAGKTWEQAWTDCANTFYNEELTEGSKIAMSFLEAVGKIVSTVQGII